MRILYIDDDKEDADIFIEAINEIDSTILCEVVTNEEGIVSKLSPCPDYIFLDYNMPHLNAIETLQVISGSKCIQTSGSKVIMYSAIMTDRQIAECKQHGALQYIKKNGDFSTTVELIRQAIQ
jgi:CheY-like chemotaxis protein